FGFRIGRSEIKCRSFTYHPQAETRLGAPCVQDDNSIESRGSSDWRDETERAPAVRTPFGHWPIEGYLLVWEVPVASSTAAWAAARRAVSRRKGEQDT